MKLSVQDINRLLSALSRDHDEDDKQLIQRLEIYRYRLTGK